MFRTVSSELPGCDRICDELRLTLKHKPRGSSGKWIQVREAEILRIDKRVGKRVLVFIQYSETNTDPNSLSVMVNCDGENYSNGFYIESKKSDPIERCINVVLKLRLTNFTKMQIWVQLLTYEGKYITGRSGEFSSANTGNVPKKRKYPEGEWPNWGHEVKRKKSDDDDKSSTSLHWKMKIGRLPTIVFSVGKSQSNIVVVNRSTEISVKNDPPKDARYKIENILN
eukprot:TRINITY_DN4375_c0_g1_i1.p1 TRINITY_DN4375_c0_g1~~TRINITY_DN4375_c0_g1_i1.p1  ORF type:complete len:226 (+),score=22.99 TRINITY_DN4375_c0_g1_i1:178-855(+)